MSSGNVAADLSPIKGFTVKKNLPSLSVVISPSLESSDKTESLNETNNSERKDSVKHNSYKGSKPNIDIIITNEEKFSVVECEQAFETAVHCALTPIEELVPSQEPATKKSSLSLITGAVNNVGHGIAHAGSLLWSAGTYVLHAGKTPTKRLTKTQVSLLHRHLCMVIDDLALEENGDMPFITALRSTAVQLQVIQDKENDKLPTVSNVESFFNSAYEGKKDKKEEATQQFSDLLNQLLANVTKEERLFFIKSIIEQDLEIMDRDKSLKKANTLAGLHLLRTELEARLEMISKQLIYNSQSWADTNVYKKWEMEETVQIRSLLDKLPQPEDEAAPGILSRFLWTPSSPNTKKKRKKN